MKCPALFILFLAVVIVSGCKTPSSTSKTSNSQQPDNANNSPLTDRTRVAAALEIIKNFAEHYQPVIRKETEGKETWSVPPFTLEQPPSQVAEALEDTVAAQSREHEKYVLLIVLRLFRTQLQIAHQDYDIRGIGRPDIDGPNALVVEFCRLTDVAPRAEFVGSGAAADWAHAHPALLAYEPIRQEMVEIDKESKRIVGRLHITERQMQKRK